MISKRVAKPWQKNPYNLTQKQLDELEVTKAQVAEHLKNVDFSKHQQESGPTEVEHQAKRVVDFVNIINPKHKKYGVIIPKEVNK